MSTSNMNVWPKGTFTGRVDVQDKGCVVVTFKYDGGHVNLYLMEHVPGQEMHSPSAKRLKEVAAALQEAASEVFAEAEKLSSAATTPDAAESEEAEGEDGARCLVCGSFSATWAGAMRCCGGRVGPTDTPVPTAPDTEHAEQDAAQQGGEA